MTAPRLVLVDGDIVINKACFAAETRWYQVTGQEEEYPRKFKYKRDADKHAKELTNAEILKCKDVLPLPMIRNIADQIINGIKKGSNCEELKIIVGPPSGSLTFRHEAATILPYKGNRDPSDRPEHLGEIRQYLIEKYKAAVAHDMETDDLLGIIQCAEEGTAIASIDKDLLQIPGLHYNINSKDFILASDPGMLSLGRSSNNKLVLKGYGYKWFCTQMLMGDAVDNIPKPVKGIGPKKGYELMHEAEEPADMWKVVEATYENSSGVSIEENATLLWILRNGTGNWEELL